MELITSICVLFSGVAFNQKQLPLAFYVFVNVHRRRRNGALISMGRCEIPRR